MPGKKNIAVFEGNVSYYNRNEVDCKACGSVMGETIYPRKRGPNKKVYTCWLCKNKWTCVHVGAKKISRFGSAGAVMLINENPRGDEFGKMAVIKAFGKEGRMAQRKPVYMIGKEVVGKTTFKEKIQRRRKVLSSIVLS